MGRLGTFRFVPAGPSASVQVNDRRRRQAFELDVAALRRGRQPGAPKTVQVIGGGKDLPARCRRSRAPRPAQRPAPRTGVSSDAPSRTPSQAGGPRLSPFSETRRPTDLAKTSRSSATGCCWPLRPWHTARRWRGDGYICCGDVCRAGWLVVPALRCRVVRWRCSAGRFCGACRFRRNRR